VSGDLFVPRDFAVPDGLVAQEFRLEPLGPQHNEADYAAWTVSISHIRATPGFAGLSWPHEMSLEDNLRDLERHARDFAERSGFTYTVLSTDTGDVIGCVYIYPPREQPRGGAGRQDAVVQSWVRADRAALDRALHDAVRTWLERDWPFDAIEYAPRTLWGGQSMNDLVVQALDTLVPGGVRRGQLSRDDRILRWVEAGSGSPVVVLDGAAGEPGSLAWAGVMPIVAPRTRVVAYDRAGIGASDPVWPLALSVQVDDLTAVIRETGNGPSVVAGHSWGGLLAQLVALEHSEVIAGMVLVDPADERFLAVPREGFRQGLAVGEAVLEQYASGALANTVRDVFRPFAQHLTDDQQVQELILDAYVSCYAAQSQARMVLGEHRLISDSLALIQESRERRALPDVPVVIFSATADTPREEREAFTAYHADLAASVPNREHVILADTDHAINQERPAEIAEAIIRVIEG
jgi:pimeloyl-ACP methyl ester carboxylesterase